MIILSKDGAVLPANGTEGKLIDVFHLASNIENLGITKNTTGHLTKTVGRNVPVLLAWGKPTSLINGNDDHYAIDHCLRASINPADVDVYFISSFAELRQYILNRRGDNKSSYLISPDVISHIYAEEIVKTTYELSKFCNETVLKLRR